MREFHRVPRSIVYGSWSGVQGTHFLTWGLTYLESILLDVGVHTYSGVGEWEKCSQNNEPPSPFLSGEGGCVSCELLAPGHTNLPGQASFYLCKFSLCVFLSLFSCLGPLAGNFLGDLNGPNEYGMSIIIMSMICAFFTFFHFNSISRLTF